MNSIRIFVFYLLVAAAGCVVVFLCLHLIWRAIGAYRITRAGPRPLASGRHVIWRNPGPIRELDLRTALEGLAALPLHHFDTSKSISRDLNPACR